MSNENPRATSALKSDYDYEHERGWLRRVVCAGFLFLCFVCAVSAQERRAHIGYVFPSGGRQGTTVEVLVGGQALGAGGRRPDGKSNLDVLVSGDGLSVKVAKVYPPFRQLDRDQRMELIEKLWDLREKQFAKLPNGEQIRQEMMELGRGNGLIPPRIIQQMAARQQQRRPAITPLASAAPGAKNARVIARGPQGRQQRAQARAAANTPARTALPPKPTPSASPEPIPEHPLLRNLETKSLRQLQEVIDELLIQRRRQQNNQIGEVILLEITIAEDAIPGPRHIRLSSPAGLTNPLTFNVGTWPEVNEQEPNDPGEYPMLPPVPAVSVPFVLNGQVKAGDVDRFRFFAQKGQNIVIQAHARDLMPYLADAVPGWFQATMSLYDANGREVAYADDYRFSPDPVLLFKIPADGEYDLEVRDSIYRGREDFVYRIEVGEKPFITAMYPLGGQQGVNTIASVSGWNLTDKKVRFDTRQPGIHDAVMTGKNGRSNLVAYDVGTIPECLESESNDSAGKAQHVTLPITINGRIDKAGDVDHFRFSGRGGEQIVAEVIGRRLESPIDSLVRVSDAEGQVIAWNDDFADRSQALKTHYADSFVIAKLPRDGDYIVQLSDSQRHGGDSCVYRLRIEQPRPDFEVRVTPSSLNFNGRSQVLTAVAIRRDGFSGDIEIAVKNPGFELSGNRIPRGRDSVRMTISAPPRQPNGTLALDLEARAQIGGKLVSRAVIPCEEMEQAFAYRHLVPSRDLAATARGGGRPPFQIQPSGPQPVVIPAGGTTAFRITMPPNLVRQVADVELNQPPDGIKIKELQRLPDGSIVAQVQADAKKAGFADNLIFEIFNEITPRQQQRPGARPAPVATAAPSAKPAVTPAPQKRRISGGMLPAVPIEVR